MKSKITTILSVRIFILDLQSGRANNILSTQFILYTHSRNYVLLEVSWIDVTHNVKNKPKAILRGLKKPNSIK